MLLKGAKTRRLFYTKTVGLNNSFIPIENNFRFLIAKFKFKVKVHCGLWEKKHPVVTLKQVAAPLTTANLKLACVVCYLKIINILWKNNICILK